MIKKISGPGQGFQQIIIQRGLAFPGKLLHMRSQRITFSRTGTGGLQQTCELFHQL
jgi:hypothetical protein